jgi:hypothetical protein
MYILQVLRLSSLTLSSINMKVRYLMGKSREKLILYEIAVLFSWSGASIDLGASIKKPQNPLLIQAL